MFTEWMEWEIWYYNWNMRDQEVDKKYIYWHSEDLDSNLYSALYQLYELGLAGDGDHISFLPEKLGIIILLCNIFRIFLWITCIDEDIAVFELYALKRFWLIFELILNIK